MPEKQLPFPRGMSFSDGGLVTMGDATMSHLEGKLYEVDDTVHGTGRKIILRCVKNDTSAAIVMARKLASFSGTSTKDFGGRIGAMPNTTDGGVCKPMDDAMTVGYSIPANDLFYVVESGLCYCTGAASYSQTAGNAVASDNAGLIKTGAAAAGKYVVGAVDVTGTTGSASVVVDVAPGIYDPPAA